MRARYGGAFGTSAALHGAVVVCLVWSTYVPPSRAQQKAARQTEVVLLPPSEDSQFPGLKPVERSRGGARLDDLRSEGQIAGADVDRIGGHLFVLFPFVNPGLALDAFFPSIPSFSRLVFENPYARRPAERVPQKRDRLAMTPAQLQALVDKSWTRAHRWKAFAPIRQLIQNGNADDERLAALIALYRDQNALQPYADGSVRDLRLWAQLGLAADHADFIGFIRGYAAAHPSTKVTTELLFLIDTLAQANADALAVLVETNQPGDLEWTKETHPRAFLLAREIQRVYARDIVRLGLTSRPAIEEFYGRGRLSILTRILATTPDGYRADDARFLMGEVLWNQGRTDDALSVWRTMTAGPSDATYAIVIAQLRDAVRPAKPDARNIRFILRNQQGRWMSFSDDRLRRFGYRADAY
jgi:hypothetical protein